MVEKDLQIEVAHEDRLNKSYHMLANLRVSFKLSPAIGRNSCKFFDSEHTMQTCKRVHRGLVPTLL